MSAFGVDLPALTPSLCRLNIRSREVIADVEQWQRHRRCYRVAHAVAIVQRGRMSALAETSPCRVCVLTHLCRESDLFNGEHVQQIGHRAGRRVWRALRQHDLGFEYRRRAYVALRCEQPFRGKRVGGILNQRDGDQEQRYRPRKTWWPPSRWQAVLVVSQRIFVIHRKVCAGSACGNFSLQRCEFGERGLKVGGLGQLTRRVRALRASRGEQGNNVAIGGAMMGLRLDAQPLVQVERKVTNEERGHGVVTDRQ